MIDNDVLKQYGGLFLLIVIGSQIATIRKSAADGNPFIKIVSRLIISLVLCVLADKYIRQYLEDHYWFLLFAISAFSLEIYDFISQNFMKYAKKLINKKIDNDNTT